MARPRNTKRDEAFQIWLESKGQMLLKDIAEQLDLSDSQIRKWKNQVTKRTRGTVHLSKIRTLPHMVFSLNSYQKKR
ncbi:MAG: phage terminase small subunit-related protein [Solibacillus sp.]